MTALATNVAFNESELVVSLADGRTITAPLEWFPRLLKASTEERSNWRLIGAGVGIAWDNLDEDISVSGLLAG
jgi:hypothetical protein